MEYPILNVKQKSRQMLDAFLGYNHNLRIGDNEFYDMKNMTSDYYPVLAPRKNRGVYKDNIKANGIIAKDIITENVNVTIDDKVCYVEGSAFVIGEHRIEMGLSDSPKSLISMGAYIIIMPDKKWINTQSWYDNGTFNDADGWGDIDYTNTVDLENIKMTLCTLTGDAYNASWDKPEEKNGAVWMDNSTNPPVLKQYSESQKMWVSVATTYVKIEAAGIGLGLSQYDGVEISGFAGTGDTWGHLDGSHVIWDCDEGGNWIIITGIPHTASGQESDEPLDAKITITRKMPKMDFVIESNNRLWGCRYGLDNNGNAVNEIYASKLGDFKNWNCYMGIATDSYAASCGTDGPFTGAITHLGYPLFFKENCVHKVYGDYPANFQIQDTTCRGVQKGSHNSLAIVNETLFYKSLNGVCAYDGSLPVEMSSALGEVRYSDAVACGHGNKYYITMYAGKISHLFVYDTAKGMWHKEDNLRVDAFCSYGCEIYAIDSGTKNIITMLGSGTEDTENVEWMAESGLIGMNMPDMKYISKLVIRMSLAVEAKASISIEYDSDNDWEIVWAGASNSLRSFSVPIRPRRCDHFRIRIEGEGEARIYSITRPIEQGSDVS